MSHADYTRGAQDGINAMAVRLAEAEARALDLERQLAARVDELTAAKAKAHDLLMRLADKVDELTDAQSRITEADRVLVDCRKWPDSNVGPECYTYDEADPCWPCQVRHALGYGESP